MLDEEGRAFKEVNSPVSLDEVVADREDVVDNHKLQLLLPV